MLFLEDARIFEHKDLASVISDIAQFSNPTGGSLVFPSVANQKNVSNSIWFHNDFLSIFYSYGILPLIIYINLFVNIYKKHKKIIRSNIFIFLTFSGFWLSAFFNGFYYYYTVILLYLFYTMIYESNEVSDIRD